MALKNTHFSDIYLGEEGGWMSGVPGAIDPVPTPSVDYPEVLSLRVACEEAFKNKPDQEDFSLVHGDIGFRVSVMKTIIETVFVLRRLSDTITPLSELGIPPPMVEMMMRPAMTGLFIVSGSFGQGKTTTASSLVAARIARFGGIAVTIEEPPEMPLHGKHGDGYCFQTWVERGGFGHACRQAARWAPSIIFLGEIRDQETAMEALRASINGRLVICTAHADNCAMAIERVFALANSDGASADDVLGMLATGLVAVLHQRLEKYGTGRQLMLDPLFLTEEDGPGARSIIRSRRFDQLKSMVQLQRNRLIVSRRSAPPIG